MSDARGFSRAEQETTVTYMRDDDRVRIYTCSRPDLVALRKLASTRDFVTEVAGGEYWGTFEVSRASFRLLSAIRAKRQMSEASRAAAAERLAVARGQRGVEEV